jgi:inner membrane protein
MERQLPTRRNGWPCDDHVDNLTHTLAGAALGEAGLRRLTPLAMPTLLIGANLPDIDVVAMAFSSGLAYRRGWTHGVLALVVLPVLLTMAVLAWDRWVRSRPGAPAAPRARPRQLLLISFVAVLSHPLLDWLNTYGMRWLMPFDGTWFYGDALFIVDPWVWIALGLGVTLSRRRRRVAPAVAAVGVTVLYMTSMIGTSWYGRRLVEERMGLAAGSVERLMVGPLPVDPTRRDVVVLEGGRYHKGVLYLLPRPQLVVHRPPLEPNLDHPFLRTAAVEGRAEHFLRWARFPFFVIEDDGAGLRVWLDDLRYSDGVNPSWAAVRWEPPRLQTMGSQPPR